MQGVVTSINAPRALTELRKAAVLRDATSIDNSGSARLFLAGTAGHQTFLQSYTSLMAVQLTFLS